MRQRMLEAAMPIEIFVESAANSATRVPGTAIFMSSSPSGVPHALLHNMKHNKIIHERVIVMTVVIEDVPFVEECDQVVIDDLGQGFYRMVLRYGFMQETDIPRALSPINKCGPKFDMMQTSFFLSRQTLYRVRESGHGDLARKAVRVDAQGTLRPQWNSSAADEPRRRACSQVEI